VLAALITPEMLEGWWASLQSINPFWALGVVWVLLLLAGAGLPLSEDIPLTFTGILLGMPSVDDHFGGFWPAVAIVGFVCYTSIIAGDLIAYYLGRRYGRGLTGVRPFKWFLTRKRLEKLDGWFKRFGNWTVFWGRMVAGVRFVTFFMAGTTRMPVSKFILFDSLAALVTVPIWITLGIVLGAHFEEILAWMGRLNTGVWVAVGALAVALIAWKIFRRKQAASTPDPLPPTPQDTP